MIGTIVKGIAGFYYVKVEDKIFECKARGVFRNINLTPFVGDEVKIEIGESGQDGKIVEILPRKNLLIRPPVSNADQVIIVFAAKNPEPNLHLLDRFLILVEEQGLKPCICINKIDIDEEENFKNMQSVYKKAGYKVLLSSARMGLGIDGIKNELINKNTVFAGPSGVGKSSLLNCIDSTLKLKTGVISEKIKRGKHTTRHVELLPLKEGGFILDTPGFSSLSLEHIKLPNLQYFYKEFTPYNEDCKFSKCSHIHEPQCKVREKVEEGMIDRERYNRYKFIYEELEIAEKRRW
ncbi:MAG: ribosome small subunit-dependent GTPase A [Epulopiscium sp.]|nr:ribosome small subunit-dependent GTPase A [Candidatus Epulonipiscium sp.]